MNAGEVLHTAIGSVLASALTAGGLLLSKRVDWKQARLGEQEAYYKRLHDDLSAAREELDAIREERLRAQEDRLAEREDYAKRLLDLETEKASLVRKVEALTERVRHLEARVRDCETCPTGGKS